MSRSSKFWFAVFLFVLLLWVLFYELCSQLLCAGVLAFLLRPLTDRLAKIKGINRSVAAFVTLLILFLLLGAVLWLVLPQAVSGFSAWEEAFSSLGDTFARWSQKLEALTARFGIRLLPDRRFDPTKLFSAFLDWIRLTVQKVGESITGVGFVLISCFYLLSIPAERYQAMSELLPQQYLPYLKTVSDQTGKMLRGYLHGRILLAAFVGAFCGLGFWLCRLEHPLLYALILFCFDFIPYFGPFVGGAFPVLMALQSGGVFYALAVLGIIAAAQQLENSVVGAHIEANAVGVHPLCGMFSLFACSSLFGFAGLFLAMPIAGWIKILFETFYRGNANRIVLQEQAKE